MKDVKAREDMVKVAERLSMSASVCLVRTVENNGPACKYMLQ